MSRNIPSVRQWRIKGADGNYYIVLAPTQLLARLNFRDCKWFPVLTGPAPVRKERDLDTLRPVGPDRLVYLETIGIEEV